MSAALVMARAARAGHVNTRLEPLLGADGCAALQARLTERAARLAGEAAPGAAFVAVDPPGDAELVRELVGGAAEVFAQAGGDLGERLAAATAHVFERRGGPLVVIGTDAPTIGRRHFDSALATIADGDDVAIGPALDGGYYLIALARPSPELFALPADEWGGPHVLGLTLRAAREGGLKARLIEPARDLDTPADAEALLAGGDLPEEVAALLRVPADR